MYSSAVVLQFRPLKCDSSRVNLPHDCQDELSHSILVSWQQYWNIDDESIRKGIRHKCAQWAKDIFHVVMAADIVAKAWYIVMIHMIPFLLMIPLMEHDTLTWYPLMIPFPCVVVVADIIAKALKLNFTNLEKNWYIACVDWGRTDKNVKEQASIKSVCHFLVVKGET